MTASTEASTSHAHLDFFQFLWLSEAIFSSGVPSTESVLFVYFRCYLTFSSSSEFLFILSEVSHLQDCPPCDNHISLLKGLIHHLITLSFPPHLQRNEGTWCERIMRITLPITSEKNNQLSISSGKSGGIVEVWTRQEVIWTKISLHHTEYPMPSLGNLTSEITSEDEVFTLSQGFLTYLTFF